MLMGTAEERKLDEPAKKTVFIEDLTPEERSRILKEKTGVLDFTFLTLILTLFVGSTARRFSEYG